LISYKEISGEQQIMNITVQQGLLVSVIVPVKNGEGTLEACLRSIHRSYYTNYEILVVNDHSTDGSTGIAQRNNCRLLDLTEGQGANAARNYGASQAHGEIFLFVDADIIVGRETVLEIVESLKYGDVDAVVGIYTAKHRHESFVSQYKNLWVRYSYMKSSPAIDWLFGSISGIKRRAFEQLGGFNTGLLARHGHDDIEFGKRFSQARLSIMLNMDIEVEHLKQYTFLSFVRNQFHRSVGFAQLATSLGETGASLRRGFVNVPAAFVLSTFVAVALLCAVVLDLAGVIPRLWSSVIAGMYLLLNIRFLNYLEQVRGLFAMVVMVPFLFIDHLICFAGSVVGVLRGIMNRSNPS
jgi:glycosyltransferase involved in cell wall biosynthesis